MKAILKGAKALSILLQKLACWMKKRAKKEPRKLKGKPKALTPLQILLKLP